MLRFLGPDLEWWQAEAARLPLKVCKRCRAQIHGSYETHSQGRSLLYECSICGEREYVAVREWGRKVEFK